ncbi:DNA mismatch repair endonuclease MutH [Fluoribacter dumoffii]|uniref:DNA mismatch repair protein MutH n=1 Tax=Fluoribacter dumoffii TaxID=463 RepID=A0A377G9K3_9GAMM|nr:DNA mismatch repair endonuclease MutH [Fluoribacter dumoffii]KTC90352.1 DNA mismatch repair protein mutH [Fluoribacter dumoffii NY 23]MCW8385669.1 DNA mismatch repair endonuclease MutH [Fluoribacter dumoffii]MCW8418699.1 DNA mismatch repair endonuclease MutH [Fluoribacter dumoffii]MCW8453457.1 DNA mismatch repair endonuclease MutH [Fluoribacter dumoffii]MCW8459323.1 DNA mismatch repair endonuclease MutH [Fluoribacter dumoffii]
MSSLLKLRPPKTEAEIIERCTDIAGLSFAQLGFGLDLPIPDNPNQRKGWVGQAIELALGTDAQNNSLPDFKELGVELKTLPLNKSGKPTESTFITSIPLLTIHKQEWKTSQCYLKLRRILWIPIEGDADIPYHQRRVGQGFLWSPDKAQENILEADWSYLSLKIGTGQLESLDAKEGEYLQVRPKAANGKSLCYGYDIHGNKIKTLPRGFYLRSRFTTQILLSFGI